MAVTNAAKPVASIATLADYPVNGYWQYEGTVAHRFAGNTITYNISGLNTAEQVTGSGAARYVHVSISNRVGARRRSYGCAG